MQLIEHGDKLTISTISGFQSKHMYPSRVEEVLGEYVFLISAPIFKGQVIMFPVYKEFIFLFYTKSGLYKSNGIILEYCNQNRVTLMRIKVNEFEHIQRRDFYRVNVTMPFAFTIMQNSEDSEYDNNPSVYKGVIKNVSGNGICFTTDEQLYINEHVLCRLSFENTIITAEGVILSSEAFGNYQNLYICRLMFVNIGHKQQEELIKYIFKIERGIIFKQKIKTEEKKNR